MIAARLAGIEVFATGGIGGVHRGWEHTLDISADLPFAASRFCPTEGLANVTTLSTVRGRDFHGKYGVDITDGPLKGLTARGVVVLDENDKVLYSQLVPEIKQEPDYDAALAVLK